jgi:elongation factor 1-gamma
MGKTNKTPEFLAKFPWGKIPAMETPEGNIFESNAIAFYVASKKPELVGKSVLEQSLIMEFACNLDCELIPAYQKVLYPLLGYLPYEATQWNASLKELLAKLKVFDTILRTRTFLVGESITLADLLYVSILTPLYTHILDSSMRSDLVNLTRYYVTVANQENVKAVIGEMNLCTKTADSSTFKSKVAAVAATSAQNDDEEDAPVVKPKEKNAMDLLPPSKFNLEDWKRFYSNCKETRPVATNWFWEHFDREGFSIWRADYKYNEELKKIFMTCNLVTGLFARMDLMRKYCFASVLIFGEDDKNEITGFFVIRGSEMPDLMKDVPDFECYNWTKMDVEDKKQVELFNDYLAWEGELEGKTVNQGKTFK